MIALRYLEPIKLYKSTKIRNANGSLSEVNELIGQYAISKQEMNDSNSISLYGARIEKMYRITSPYYKLEKIIKSKNNPVADNVSDYFFVLNNERYRITSSREKWIDIEFVEMYD